MMTDIQKRILIYITVGVVVCLLGYFTIEQLKFETQLDDLKKFCGGLKIQSSAEDVRIAATFSSGLQLTLLEPTVDGAQLGSIYFEGAGRGGCSVTFMRGLLTQKAFFYGTKDPMKPGEKLKSW